MRRPQSVPKSTAIEVLRLANYDRSLINEIMSQLPDPIDLDRDSQVLTRYGVTADELMSRRGGSP